jgi:hypothetical protein
MLTNIQFRISCLLASYLKHVTIKTYETAMLPVVLYRCETSSFTLKEERRLRAFENRVLRGIFGAKKNEVVGGWRKLDKKELRNLHSSPNVIRIVKLMMRLAWHVARAGEKNSAYMVFVAEI